MLKEPHVNEYLDKLGENFKNSNPEVYKQGILKRAKLQVKEGQFQRAFTTIQSGFNIISLKKRYDPSYLKTFIALRLTEARDKKKREAEAKRRAAGGEKAEEVKKEDDTKHDMKLSSKFNLDNLREDIEETQKKMPEEDFENKKLLPILQEAFDLVDMLEKKKKETHKQLKRLDT